MQLQTNISIERAREPINYDSRLLLLGSCFTENIGEKLNYFKFQSLQNPFGILFHPVAVERLIERAVNQEFYKAHELINTGGFWACFDAHSRLNASSPEEILGNLNHALEQTGRLLLSGTHVIITLGTSWVYRYIETDRVVANCHKIPQKRFLKELLTVDEVLGSLEKSIALVKSVNPAINVLLTTSPVRHVKDGFVENQRSKSHLIAAIHEVVDPRNKIHYFPSYEILMDELRDYRFYGEDMIHPNQIAVNYIWEKFKGAWISPETYPIMKEVAGVQRGLGHLSFNPDSEQHKKFLEELQQKITYLQQEFPFMKFNK